MPPGSRKAGGSSRGAAAALGTAKGTAPPHAAGRKQGSAVAGKRPQAENVGSGNVKPEHHSVTDNATVTVEELLRCVLQEPEQRLLQPESSSHAFTGNCGDHHEGRDKKIRHEASEPSSSSAPLHHTQRVAVQALAARTRAAILRERLYRAPALCPRKHALLRECLSE
eukprot:GHVU01154222.1.p4 GENE.GHVU01154222.1~~GHVU01154222.1.p4  ORF type:complete len:168 (-),score=28.07 GHVU01154222.1:2634-3137(-)